MGEVITMKGVPLSEGISRMRILQGRKTLTYVNVDDLIRWIAKSESEPEWRDGLIEALEELKRP